MIGLAVCGVSVACNFLKTMTTDKLYQRIALYVNLHSEFNLARYQTQRWNRSGFSRPDPTGKFQNHRRLTGRSTGRSTGF